MYLFTILYFSGCFMYCLFKSNWKAAPLPPQNYIIKKILLKNFSRILSHSNYFFPYPFMLLITRVLWRIQWRHRYRHQLSQRVQTMWPTGTRRVRFIAPVIYRVPTLLETTRIRSHTHTWAVNESREPTCQEVRGRRRVLAAECWDQEEFRPDSSV